MARAKVTTQKVSVESAIDFAFSEMESIRDELQGWYDNLPESFQNGSKGEALQEAIDAIDEAEGQPDVPEVLDSQECEYGEYGGKIGRPKRRDSCVNALNAACEAARNKVEELNELVFNADGVLLVDGQSVNTDEYEGDLPCTESERDEAVTDCDSFADSCENIASEWENVEFPGMYG